MPGQPTRAGAEGELAARCLTPCETTTVSGYDVGVSVAALSQRWRMGLAPDSLWLAI